MNNHDRLITTQLPTREIQFPGLQDPRITYNFDPVGVCRNMTIAQLDSPDPDSGGLNVVTDWNISYAYNI